MPKRSFPPFLAFIYPVPDDDAGPFIASHGLPSVGLPLPDAPLAPPAIGTSLTKVQGEIVVALTKSPPLNERQVAVLEIYCNAYSHGEPALSIEMVGTRLEDKVAIDPARAAAYVKGALRSFGKRLFAALSKLPVQIGKDAMGGGVADEIPLLALLSIEKGPTGETRHKLTADGAAAVAAALALNAKGEAASSPPAGTDDPNEIVTLAMTRLAAALIMRVAKSKGIGVDEAVKLMTALAGAG